MNVGKSLSPQTKRLDPGLLSIALALSMLIFASRVWGGAACVVAKRLGDSLAIEWVTGPEVSAASALAMAKGRLLDQGYRAKGQDVHAQASTELKHAYVAIVKTMYVTAVGRARTSYGCGYSVDSPAKAERAAVYDLRNYSWGWKAEFGYEVMARFRY